MPPAEDAPLIVVDARAEGDDGVKAVLRTASAVVRTAPGHQVLAVGDGRAGPEVEAALERGCDLLDVAFVAPDEPLGHAARINTGLEVALVTGRDAALIGTGVEPAHAGWLDRLAACAEPGGAPAGVAGGRLEQGPLVVSAGLERLRFYQVWFHRLRYTPVIGPASAEPAACPVSAAFQYVRHAALERVGLYDEEFADGWGDVDFCLRVTAAGLPVRYEPTAAATIPFALLADGERRHMPRTVGEIRLDAKHPSPGWHQG